MHGCQLLTSLFRAGNFVIAVNRSAIVLDCRIEGHQAFHLIHVRHRSSRNWNQLKAKVLRDKKMTVITGSRTDKFELSLL